MAQFITAHLNYHSQRMPIYAKNCIATPQPLAAQAGLKALQQGGNAVDAAIATAITLTVVEPTMNGLGSDLFAIVWDGKQLHGINASGKSTRAWSRSHFEKYKKMPEAGWDTITVPGAVSGWVALSRECGCLPFEQLFEQAVYYAEHGFLVSPIVAESWKQFASFFKENQEFAKVFLPNNRAPYAGELFLSPDLARTLKKLQSQKVAHFIKVSSLKK